ncbi:hypothetical protein FD755_010906, partial [Muntiacus reevesi]
VSSSSHQWPLSPVATTPQSLCTGNHFQSERPPSQAPQPVPWPCACLGFAAHKSWMTQALRTSLLPSLWELEPLCWDSGTWPWPPPRGATLAAPSQPGLLRPGGPRIVLAGWGRIRSSLVITTKIFWGGKAETERGLSRKHIIEGLKASLERLQLEYVDVVFANRPDPNTPMEGDPFSSSKSRTFIIEETVRAMTHVINQGMAMYWGTSRWSSMEIMEAYSVARQFNLIPPICEQAEYHMFQREKVEVQLPELFHKIGVGAMTWSPLACGIVSGKYDSGIPPYSRASLKGYQWLKDKILSEEGRRQQAKLKELQAIAERLGCTLPQLAIAWCLRNEGVSSVLLGASSADQLMENIGAIQVLPKLSSSIIHEIDSILGNKPYSKKDYRS